MRDDDRASVHRRFTMFKSTDITRGFDVMRGSRVLRHFESYDEAIAYMRAGRGRWVRYWGVKG